jgi:hypothetical protein
MFLLDVRVHVFRIICKLHHKIKYLGLSVDYVVRSNIIAFNLISLLIVKRNNIKGQYMCRGYIYDDISNIIFE